MLIGPSNGQFQQDLLRLLHQEKMPPSMFLAITFQNSVWVCFQIEGIKAQINRFRANIRAFSDVTCCSEQEANSPLMHCAIAEAMKCLWPGAYREDVYKQSMRTFRGLQ
jgi:hypothetical protein